ncbi:MAG: MATE family efflux transporter [Kiritimatiellae bacterium]|nr:MATE family efflux transporter [Kiritimatiellia bacterium]
MKTQTDTGSTGRVNGALLQGRLDTAVLSLAGPMFASALLQNAQSLIDLFWVGRLGSSAVAALALAGTVLMALFPLTMGLATGTVALVSRAFGSGDMRQASRWAGQSLAVALVAGLLLGFGCLPFIRPACELLSGDQTVVRLAGDYLRVMMYGMFSGMLLFLASSSLQGAGNTVGPMCGMLLANLLNLALDPLFIFGWGCVPAGGVAGAAWATVLSQVITGAAMIGLLAGGRTRLRLMPADLWPRLDAACRLLRIGVPSMAQMLSRSLMSLVFFKIVARYGTAVVAGYGIGMRFHMVLLMPCFVFGNAAATLVGQNLGAGQPARARRAAWVSVALVTILMAVSALLMWWLASGAVSLFDRNPEVVAIGSGYLRTVTPFYIFAGFSIVLDRALNGAGCTLATMIFTMLTLWVLQVPLALWLASHASPPVQGIWWAICIATTAHAAMSVSWFETGRWQRARV